MERPQKHSSVRSEGIGKSTAVQGKGGGGQTETGTTNIEGNKSV